MFEPRKKTRAELVEDLRTHLSFLKDNLLQYDSGKKGYYKNVAKELHILLCDKSCDRSGKKVSDNSLIPKIFQI
jgi:hypothetical protein